MTRKPNRSAAVMAKRVAKTGEPDFYPTPYWATRALLDWMEAQGIPLKEKQVWEPAAGEMHMARILKERFALVHCSDAFDYGQDYPKYDIRQTLVPAPLPGRQPTDWVITNPPFSLTMEFTELCRPWGQEGMALLCRSAFAETRGRYERIFRNFPPTDILQFVDRVAMARGRLTDPKESSATAYAWFVWMTEREGANNPEYGTRFHWLSQRKNRDSEIETEERENQPSLFRDFGETLQDQEKRELS